MNISLTAMVSSQATTNAQYVKIPEERFDLYSIKIDLLKNRHQQTFGADDFSKTISF
jgi:hypothetical protein